MCLINGVLVHFVVGAFVVKCLANKRKMFKDLQKLKGNLHLYCEYNWLLHCDKKIIQERGCSYCSFPFNIAIVCDVLFAPYGITLPTHKKKMPPIFLSNVIMSFADGNTANVKVSFQLYYT